MRTTQLYFLLAYPIEGAIPAPLPKPLASQTIESSLWNQEEKALLRQHSAYFIEEVALEPDPIEAMLTAYRRILEVPAIVGIANPWARTAHHARWAAKIFLEGLEATARQVPPLHLWTGLLPFTVEPALADLAQGVSTFAWLRTYGYGQFGLPELAHPFSQPNEAGWIHSLFEVLFDWMYFGGRILAPGDPIEVPERGRYWVQALAPDLLALYEV
ncbi:MAG: hypothetical protein NZ580_06465 [Bacteroidia bacterium]|nr:hypothetical protein [Bacteroidia bacterium]MDW8236530.1 hypothetical protein [Bacteroidia bacterium]